MKKNLFLLAALAFAGTGTGFAQSAVKTTGSDANQTARHYAAGRQDQKNPAKMADRKAGKMAKELGLSADQETKVEQLLLVRDQESTALKTKYGRDRKAGRPEMKAAHDRYEAQLKTILTPEQFAKMNQLKAEHHGHDGGHDHDGGKMKEKAKS